MSLMKLVIKGNSDVALRALSARKLDGNVEESNFPRETFAYVSEENYRVVAEWFAENPAMIPGYGFPDGTLLYYIQLPKREVM